METTAAKNSVGMRSFFILLLSLCCLTVFLQDSLSVTLKQQLLKDWQRAKAYTLEYLNSMPADKYGFHPVDSVRSFGEQMLHLAQANAGLASIGTSFQSASAEVFFNPKFEKSPISQNKDSVIFYVSSSYDIVIDAIKSLDIARFSEVISWNLPGSKRTATRLVWLMKAFEHQTHHRGQCTVYLRLVGIRPPGEMLWDE